MSFSALHVIPGSSHRTSSASAFVVMNKKKKKKKKKSKSQNNSVQEPPRITSNVRQNLDSLKFFKDYQHSKYGSPKASTSYRKKKVAKENVPDDDEHVSQEHDDEPPVLRPSIRILLVDGYNVCGYWPKLKEHFSEGRLNLARKMLIDELITFTVMEGLKVVVVFDARFSGFPTHKEKYRSIDVVFSGRTTADTWIEEEVMALVEDGRYEVWVATSDVLHQQMAFALGASIWSCEKLILEIEDSQREYKMFREQQRRPISVKKGLLRHGLDRKTFKSLKELRRQLAENESRDQKAK